MISSNIGKIKFLKMKNKIILIQLWFGEIPDYFWYHYETTKDILGFDFILFTDQNIKLNSKNYKVVNITKEDIELKLLEKLNYEIKIPNNKKTCDLKSSFGDLFKEYILDYEYFGCYDIDTLFGEVYKGIKNYLGHYDFITIGNKTFHNRLSGPFLIIKNTEDLRTLYKNGDYVGCMLNENVQCYEEHTLSDLAKEKYEIKIVDSMNCETHNGGKNSYDVSWSGGKILVNGEEKILYHFYRKNKTILQKVGNQIFGRYDKKFIEDFYWVFGFTENYSQTIPFLMDSINKYSNRKCIIYSINFNYNIPNKFLTSEQFIFKRIDIEPGDKDSRGRDENIISCKPKLMIDVIDQFPNGKFIFIDSDVYLTTSADELSKYFNTLTTYPLINSHIHDVVYYSGIIDGEEWTSTAHILAKRVDVEICVFPRRKTNIMLFDEKSKWFFQEQIDMYETHKNTEVGIFKLHDEDSANVILSKYKLYDCLPLCDIEGCDNIDIGKITDLNNPFHMTQVSPNVKLPKNENDIAIFHGMKDVESFQRIQKSYGDSVVDCEEFVILYSNNTISFEKNSFMSTKKVIGIVDFVINDLNNNEVYRLDHQNFYNYWYFYLSDIILEPKKYKIKILETNTKKHIFNDILEVV
jgi:hypothetical protein